MHLPETLASRPVWSVTTCVSSPMGLGYLHQARRKQLPHLSQLYMVKAARNQRGFYAPPGAINMCVCVCLYICGSMNIGIYMCGVSVCVGVYECPCRCLSVCLSFCLSVCLSLVDVVVSLLLSMSMCVSIMVRVGRAGLRVIVAVVVVAVFLVKKTLCVCVCIVHV